MNRVELLYRLQQVDTELGAARRRLQEIESSMGETEELIQARTNLQHAEETYRQWQATLRDMELKMRSLDNKIKGNEQRLYSGTVKNSKELESLQEEMVYLRRRKSSEEDDLLEAMISVEEHEAFLQEAHTRWKTVESGWIAAQADLLQEKNDLLARSSELTEQRIAREGVINSDDMQIYKSLRQRKNGTAVARLKRNLCQRCNVEVPSLLVQQARQGELVFCNSCGRILYAGV